MKGFINYKGCGIFYDAQLGAYYWEEPHFGLESDGVFATVEAAKADIDSQGQRPLGLIDIDTSLAQMALDAQP